MTTIKQTVTPELKNRIMASVQFMLIMAEMIKMEHAADMDVRFKNPQVNQFASRIAKDAEAIRFHLMNNERVRLKDIDKNHTIEYASEMYRAFTYLTGLPLDQVKQALDALRAATTVEV